MTHNYPWQMTTLRSLSTPAVVLIGASLALAQGPTGAVSSDPRQASFESVCGVCHSTQLATNERRNHSQWMGIINQMLARGAQGTDEQLFGIVDFLSEHYGRVNVNSDPASDLEKVGGFSPAEAAAIIDHRRAHGSIDNIAELSKTTGIAESKLRANHDTLNFGAEQPGIGRVPVSGLTESTNWPTVSGNPQRDGWSREEELFSPQTVRNMKLVYRLKLDNQAKGLRALTSPIILGTMIGYQGFKQMLILSGSSDKVFNIDADLEREIWTQSFQASTGSSLGDSSPQCPPARSAVVLPGGTGRGFGAPRIRRPGSVSAPANVSRFAPAFGRTGLVVALASDGKLHALYQSNGEEAMSPVKFLPPGSIASAINLNKSTLYAATVGNCGGANALYSVDLDSEEPKVVSFPTNGGGASGSGGTAIGSDGTVFAQVPEGHGSVAGNYSDTVLALTPKELELNDYFTPVGSLRPLAKDLRPQGATPMVFSWKDKELILAGARDGRLYLLDAASLGGVDHHTPLFRSDPIAAKGSVREAFAAWEDLNTSTIWVYAAIWDQRSRIPTLLTKKGKAPDGSIAAFKVEERNGKPVLTLAWKSANMFSPAAPVTANGVVFALSTGLPSRLTKRDGTPYSVQEVEKLARPAVLYALDALTGKELFHSENASSFNYDSALAVANGHVYFTTHDNTLYAYGFPMEH